VKAAFHIEQDKTYRRSSWICFRALFIRNMQFYPQN